MTRAEFYKERELILRRYANKAISHEEAQRQLTANYNRFWKLDEQKEIA